MKVGRRRHVALSLLLVTSLVLPTLALTSPPSRSDSSLQRRDIAADPPGLSKANPVGTEHAPVDGKDGMPHDGPFIETQTERERKQYQDTGTGQLKPLAQDVKEKYGQKDLPKSNNAVMDERYSSKPAEGTRGTEGGVTEKSRDSKVAEKIPGSPKEKLPLPQSEVEKMWKGRESGDDSSLDAEERKASEVCLAVRLLLARLT